MKVKILCHHLFINGAFANSGDVVEMDESAASNIIDSDSQAGRKPRIELLAEEKPAPKPKRKRRTKAQMIADGDLPSES